MTAVTFCSDFRAQEEQICHYFHLFPLYLPCINEARCHDLSFLVVLSQLFHSPLLLSSRGSLVPLCFLLLEWYRLHAEVADVSQPILIQLVTHPARRVS